MNASEKLQTAVDGLESILGDIASLEEVVDVPDAADFGFGASIRDVGHMQHRWDLAKSLISEIYDELKAKAKYI